MFKAIGAASLCAFSTAGVMAGAFILASGLAHAAEGPAKPKIAAKKPGPQAAVITVGTVTIKKMQIDTLVNLMLKAREAQGQLGPDDRANLEKLVATNLIGQELLDQEAKRQNLVIADKEIDSAYLSFRGKFPNAQAFEAALKQTGEDEKALKAKLSRQLKADKLLNARVGQVAPPTDKDIADFFASNKKEFPISDSLRACQILLSAPKGMPAAESNRKRDQLESVRKELLQDSSSPFLVLRKFLMAASQLGEGPEKKAGGDLERFKPTDFHPDFSKHVRNLKVGEISQAFRTPLGWHLVILTERNDGKLESYKLAIAQLLMSQKTMKSGKDLRDYLQSLSGKNKVKYLVSHYKDTSAAGIYK